MGPAPITVAVVSWNTAELLDACLHALRPDMQAGLAECWVVDNASSDGSAELVEREHPDVHLLRSGSNLGFGAAVNLVARRTTTPWVAPCNADVAVRRDALVRLLAAGRRFPSAGALAPALCTPGGRLQHSVHAFPTLPKTLAFNLGLGRLVPTLGDRLALPGAWDPSRSRNVDWAHGALLLVRREAWDAVGGFDERMWMYAEDLDLAWRLRAAGWRTRYEPGAVVDHHVSAATRQAWGDGREIQAQRAAYTWLRRTRGRGRTILTASINVAGAGARSLCPRQRKSMLRYARMHATGLRHPPRAYG